QERDQRGVCLRLQCEDFVEFENVETQIFALLERLALRPRTVDLLLDLRSIIAPTQIDTDAVVRMLQAIPRPREWRSLTVTATSFPQNLMGLPPEEASVIERTEWA